MWNIYTILMRPTVIFFTHSHFFLQYLFSTSVAISHWFMSSVTAFTKKRHKCYVSKCFFFMSESPIRLYLYEIIYFKVSIDKQNSENSTKSPTKRCNSKKFRIVRNILRNVIFFSNLCQGNFLYCPKFFILNLNTARAPAEMKQNPLH